MIQRATLRTTLRALEALVVCTLSACQDAPKDTEPVNTEPSPNASILPSPLASARPLPLKDAGASSAPPVDAGDAALSDAATPAPPPSYFDTHRALESEVLPVSEAPGARLEAQFSWQPRSAVGRGDSRGRFGVRIELSSLGRMRLVITSDRMPLAENTELRARLDRYGHVLVWPERASYRVVAAGTLRAIFEELRADVSPLLEAKTQRALGGKLLGLPVHVDTIQTAMGTLVLEQAQVGDLGESGVLLCRLLSELVLAKPDNSACRTDWVPLKAEFGWVENGRFGFIVNTLERDPELETTGFMTPPEGGDFRNRQMPDKPPRLWLDEDGQRRIEPGAKVRPTPNNAGSATDPAKGLVVINNFETPRYVLVNGEVSAWMATGAELHLEGLRPGSYTLLARDFFGLEPEHPLVLNVPGRRSLGTPTRDEDVP